MSKSTKLLSVSEASIEEEIGSDEEAETLIDEAILGLQKVHKEMTGNFRIETLKRIKNTMDALIEYYEWS